LACTLARTDRPTGQVSEHFDPRSHVPKICQNPLRQKTNFSNYFNVIWAVQIAHQKYSASHFPQISFLYAPTRLIEEGRTRRHDTWSAGCGGREGARAREALQGGLELVLGL
jgi:hypothetical protein